MGSGLSACLGGGAAASAAAAQDPTFPSADDTLGHSFCYIGAGVGGGGAGSPSRSSRFRSISGAAVSANSATTPAVFPPDDGGGGGDFKPFESTALFGVVPLLPAPASGDLAAGLFLSGPIERGALSGPLDPSDVPFSAPLSAAAPPGGASGGGKRRRRGHRRSLSRSLSVVPVRTFAGGRKDPAPPPPAPAPERVQWAHGKAGEDRVHVVVSEDHRWLFVGIYDGFNGPDAPEFLMGNLHRSIFKELQGLLWDDDEDDGGNGEIPVGKAATFRSDQSVPRRGKTLWELLAEADEEDEGLDLSGSKRFAFSINCIHIPPKRRTFSFPTTLRCPPDRPKERLGQSFRRYKAGPIDHDAVLAAMARGLQSAEAAYLEMTDKFIDRNPELALMGSCLLVALMRDEDVYVMNVGDSRAIVAQYQPQEVDPGVDAEDIVETMDQTVRLAALQLSTDHSTSIEEEVLRIRQEHPDDSQCIVNDRVKGRLKVTRAFGAGFLKQPKWNDVLLEMFRNEYIGTSPYISCTPALCHHKLGPNDQFLILSSDGLYQYLTNQEAVSYVESFMERFPDGDPAQHLIEELLLRAAKKAGMDFHQLLDIPQGDRRKYHDDVTVMVISLEGRIWKSSGKYL